MRKPPQKTEGSKQARELLRLCAAGILLATLPASGLGQAAGAPPQVIPQQTPAGQTPATPASTDKDTAAEKVPRGSDRRRAAKLFLEASKQFEKQEFPAALEEYAHAAALDPTNHNYQLAADLARSHAVTALIQAAAKDRVRGDAAGERAALEQALTLDPKNLEATQHLYELGDLATEKEAAPLYEQSADSIGSSMPLLPTPGTHSFHLHTDQRRTIQEVFKAFVIEATVDDSVRLVQVRFDVDDATFAETMHALSLVTDSFYVPLDTHRALVARDTADLRKQFERLDLETVYLPGLSAGELNEVGTLAKTVFDLQHATVDPSAGTITVRAAPSTLNAFNVTIRGLIDGHSQVLLDVSLIQLAHTSSRNSGVQPPQSISAFNVYAEEQSILNANQALVQQIISSGLAAPGDTLAILGILLASGQVSSSLFTSGIALFGGGLTASALSPGAMSANLSLNSSDSKALDHLLLRLSDGLGESDDAQAIVRSGTRYPIQTSSYSAGLGSVPNIPGLTGAGSSGNLSGLLGQLGGVTANIPQVEYQDLGMTLKARSRVLRNDDVALTLDLKIVALSGSSANGNPILNNRSYSGVVTLRKDSGVVIVSELDKQESRAISGLPGLSEIPGLNNVSDNTKEANSSTLVIVMTPHVLRGTQAAGHTPMMRIERGEAAR